MPVIKDKKLQIIDKINELVDTGLAENKFISCHLVLIEGICSYHYASIDNERHAWVFFNSYIRNIIFQVGTVSEAKVSGLNVYTPSIINPPITFKTRVNYDLDDLIEISDGIINWILNKEIPYDTKIETTKT